jgi:hypothetical protein
MTRYSARINACGRSGNRWMRSSRSMTPGLLGPKTLLRKVFISCYSATRYEPVTFRRSSKSFPDQVVADIFVKSGGKCTEFMNSMCNACASHETNEMTVTNICTWLIYHHWRLTFLKNIGVLIQKMYNGFYSETYSKANSKAMVS